MLSLLALSALALPLSGLAAPTVTPAIAPPANSFPTTPKSSELAGALYSNTIDIQGNQVLVYNVWKNGSIALVKHVPTGGFGTLGDFFLPAAKPDRIFASDSVHVVDDKLLIVNTGSNTVSLFQINQQDPTNITLVGKPVSSFGEFPVSIATHPTQRDVACVLNAGAVNGVGCYNIAAGGLQPITGSFRSLGLNNTTPPNNITNTPGDIIFTEDGSKLVAAVKGYIHPMQPGFLASWNFQNGVLSTKENPRIVATKGALPFSIANIPGKNAILATDLGSGINTYDLSKVGFTANSTGPDSGNKTLGEAQGGFVPAATGNYTQQIMVPKQGASCWAVYSKQSSSWFSTDVTTGRISEIVVNDNLSGTTIKQYQSPPTSGYVDNAVGTIDGQDYVWSLAGGLNFISTLVPGDAPGRAFFADNYDVFTAINTLKVPGNSSQILSGLAAYIKPATLP